MTRSINQQGGLAVRQAAIDSWFLLRVSLYVILYSAVLQAVLYMASRKSDTSSLVGMCWSV